jgi:signal transduction histidine kinase
MRRLATVQPKTLATRSTPADSALVAAVTAFACVGIWAELHYAPSPTPSPAGAFALTLGAAAPLLIRRHAPITTAALCLLLCYIYRALGYPGFSIGMLIFLVCYTLATERGLLYGLGAALCGWMIPALPPHSLSLFTAAVVFPPVGMASMALIGETNRRRALETEARVRESAVTAEAQLGRRMAEERLRIARELHDVLAHTISVVAVQSSVALDALEAGDGSRAEAREALLAVRGAAKQAMPELRAALDLLRAGGGGDGDSGDSSDSGKAPDTAGRARPAPQPGFEQLPELARLAQDDGVRMELSIPPELGRASPLIELTTYRIVQESLTNVRKHASSARARVTIRRDADVLTVEVDDDGAGRQAQAHSTGQSQVPTRSGTEHGSGFGLLGMRERAEALGGTVVAGPRPEGGFRVRAELPWIAPAADHLGGSGIE